MAGLPLTILLFAQAANQDGHQSRQAAQAPRLAERQ